MTRQETASVLLILKAAYPQFYRDMSNDEAKATLSLWADMFVNDGMEIVKPALYQLIKNHAGYPPSIADVKEMILQITLAALSEPTDEELWHILREGVSDGLNGAKIYFEKLPPILKRYCQNPDWFRNHAVHDPQTLDTVDKSLFMKQISSMRTRMEFEAFTPDSVKRYLEAQKTEKVLGQEGLKRLSDGSSEAL